jgi:hypothetical protein
MCQQKAGWAAESSQQRLRSPLQLRQFWQCGGGTSHHGMCCAVVNDSRRVLSWTSKSAGSQVHTCNRTWPRSSSDALGALAATKPRFRLMPKGATWLLTCTLSKLYANKVGGLTSLPASTTDWRPICTVGWTVTPSHVWPVVTHTRALQRLPSVTLALLIHIGIRAAASRSCQQGRLCQLCRRCRSDVAAASL